MVEKGSTGAEASMAWAVAKQLAAVSASPSIPSMTSPRWYLGWGGVVDHHCNALVIWLHGGVFVCCILTNFENRASGKNYRAKKDALFSKIKGKYRAKI